MPSIEFGDTISYAVFAAVASARIAARAAVNTCATDPIPIISPDHQVARRTDTLRHYNRGNKLSPSHKGNVARKAFLIAN